MLDYDITRLQEAINIGIDEKPGDSFRICIMEKNDGDFHCK